MRAARDARMPLNAQSLSVLAAHAGNQRVVLMDAAQRTTHWLFYEAARSGAASASLAACYVLANDTSLQYGLLPPRDTFSQHSAFKARARARAHTRVGCACSGARAACCCARLRT
jgi:hypothetical protein